MWAMKWTAVLTDGDGEPLHQITGYDMEVVRDRGNWLT